MDLLVKWYEDLGLADVDRGLLLQALTHCSFSFDNPGVEHNERLEFLGDAVLALVMSKILYQTFPDYSEGQLSRLRANLICEASLAKIAEAKGVPQYLRLGNSVRANKAVIPTRIVASALEALIGAIYDDRGFSEAAEFVHFLYQQMLLDVNLEWSNADPKSSLQEIAQARGYDAIVYAIIEESGPDHNKIFVSQVKVGGQVLGKGQGKSKKESELLAAVEALKAMMK
ncbi:MAG: ribonuclease III [bacterium]|nr:ribonuclease III [bacterium]